MSRPYAHTSHLKLWRIPIYAYSQTWHRKKNNVYNFTALHIYSYSKPLGNTSLRALPILNHRENIRCSFSVTHAYIRFRTFGELILYMHSKYITSKQVQSTSYLGHTWHSEPLGNSCYTCTPNPQHFIECKCNLAEHHYTYVFVPYQKHMLLSHTSSMKSFSKTCHTSSCYGLLVSWKLQLH